MFCVRVTFSDNASPNRTESAGTAADPETSAQSSTPPIVMIGYRYAQACIIMRSQDALSSACMSGR
jgi:hypothetical protein